MYDGCGSDGGRKWLFRLSADVARVVARWVDAARLRLCAAYSSERELGCFRDSLTQAIGTRCPQRVRPVLSGRETHSSAAVEQLTSVLLAWHVAI